MSLNSIEKIFTESNFVFKDIANFKMYTSPITNRYGTYKVMYDKTQIV